MHFKPTDKTSHFPLCWSRMVLQSALIRNLCLQFWFVTSSAQSFYFFLTIVTTACVATWIHRWRNLFSKTEETFLVFIYGWSIEYKLWSFIRLPFFNSLKKKMIEKKNMDFNYLQQKIKKAFLKIRSDVFSELLFWKDTFVTTDIALSAK